MPMMVSAFWLIWQNPVKIDPWNIDILDVTEKYLQRMIELKSLNLRVASRTLLFAAILCELQS